MIKYNYKWSSLEEGMAKNIKKVTPAIIILLLIGAISGTWMLSGVVPTLIYYGLHTLTPQIFLASCCLICAIVSVITGSSWTTIATIGVALLGIGRHKDSKLGGLPALSFRGLISVIKSLRSPIRQCSLRPPPGRNFSLTYAICSSRQYPR